MQNNTDAPLSLMIFKVENKVRLRHLANVLSARNDCSVLHQALFFEGKGESPVSPFVDIFPGDVVLPVQITSHSNKNLVVRALEEEGLFFDQVDLADTSVGIREDNAAIIAQTVIAALKAAKPLSLSDVFAGRLKFPSNEKEALSTEEANRLDSAFEEALDVSTKLIEKIGNVEFTLITYPDAVNKPVAFEVPLIEGNEEAKDGAVRRMATILKMTGTEMYSIVSEAWQYQANKDGTPDRSKRVEIMMATTVHRKGRSRSAFREIVRDGNGGFARWGETMDTTEAMSEGRFAEIFDLLPQGKAEEKMQTALAKSRVSKKRDRHAPIKRTLH